MKEKIEFKLLNELSKLDDWIYQNEDCFLLDYDEIRSKQYEFISNAFKFHYENNEEYKEYSNNLNVNPKDIKGFDDLKKIPLVPSTMFKERDILSCKHNEIVKVCESSGTKGSISKVFRDEITLNRFLGNLQCSIDQILNLYDAFVINLGPSTEEAGDLWFSYAMNAVDMVFPTENAVVDGVFKPEDVIKFLMDNFFQYENIVVIGSPVMFLELINYMEDSNITIEDAEKIYFVTAGGWKRYSGEKISNEGLFKMIESRFIYAKADHYRDFLNMVELNTILTECEYHVKHIVPWVKIRIIDPVTQKDVQDGEYGLISYLDPSPTSYPGFILTDDIGRIVFNDGCRCGRHGQGLEMLRRVENIESRGCALKIDKNYATSKKQ